MLLLPFSCCCCLLVPQSAACAQHACGHLLLKSGACGACVKPVCVLPRSCSLGVGCRCFDLQPA